MQIIKYSILCKYFTVLALLFLTPTITAQGIDTMEIEEIHTLTEKLVNYSPDSTLKLLDIASEKIARIEDEDEANSYRASNNLRRADYWIFDDPQKSKEYLTEAQTYYEQNVDNKKLAEIFCLKAQLIKIEGQGQIDAVQKAIPYFNQALDYALKQTNPRTISFIYYENAITLQQTERWHESLENALQAVRFSELAGDSLSVALAYFLMGRTYEYFGFLEKSEAYMAKAVDYGRGIDLLFVVIYHYGHILLENNKTEMALENYHRALQMCVEKNRLERALDVYTSIGLLQFGEGNYEKAKEAYHAISELDETVDMKRPIIFLFKAKMNHYWGFSEKTLSYLEGLKTSSNEIIADDIDIYKEAAELYMQLGFAKESAFYYQKWGTLKDSLQSYINRVQLNELEKLYFNERAKNEEITLKNEELKKSRTSQANMGIALMLFLIIGGSATYFIRLKGIRENQKLKFALKEKQLEHLMEGQETERQRLARELHDGIGQSLAALKLQLQFEENNIPPSKSAVDRVDDLCKEVRSLSHQMMPLVLKQNGLEDAIQQLLKASFRNTNIELDFVTNGIKNRLPDKVEVHLYRITQELISNILKHANASKVGVQLLLRKNTVVLIVEDNGNGFKGSSKSGGIGISNIHSRVEAMSGTVKVQSTEGEGTYVHIAIPVNTQLNKKIA